MIRIDDEQVEHAFDILKSGDHAVTRAAYEFADKQLKVILARAAIASNAKTVGERSDSALASPAYDDALNAFRTVAEAYHTQRDKRDAATAIIDAWRTQQSDMRAMGRVG